MNNIRFFCGFLLFLLFLLFPLFLLAQVQALDGPDLAKARELLGAELPSLKVSRPPFISPFMSRHVSVWLTGAYGSHTFRPGMAESWPAGSMRRAENLAQLRAQWPTLSQANAKLRGSQSLHKQP